MQWNCFNELSIAKRTYHSWNSSLRQSREPSRSWASRFRRGSTASWKTDWWAISIRRRESLTRPLNIKDPRLRTSVSQWQWTKAFRACVIEARAQELPWWPNLRRGLHLHLTVKPPLPWGHGRDPVVPRLWESWVQSHQSCLAKMAGPPIELLVIRQLRETTTRIRAPRLKITLRLSQHRDRSFSRWISS